MKITVYHYEQSTSFILLTTLLLYNGTTCEAIKDGRSCMANGRADPGYLHWQWQSRGCDLPAFSPDAFLPWLRNNHLAFVGDSLSRNQAESLVCLLSSRSPPELARHDADSRFRRWVFREHGNASVSVFWSPLLVRGIEKAERTGERHNSVFLDAFDERWIAELAGVDVLELSAGHWFKIPRVYHEGGHVVRCHGCAAAGLNSTVETGYFAAFRDKVHRTLAEVPRRWHANNATDANKLVAMGTFSPSHFEGD
jgi:xyloglucan O-acetyltransferase